MDVIVKWVNTKHLRNVLHHVNVDKVELWNRKFAIVQAICEHRQHKDWNGHEDSRESYRKEHVPPLANLNHRKRHPAHKTA